MVDYDIEFNAVNIPVSSGGATVTLEEDNTGDGNVDVSETITLSDGVTSYSTSSNSFQGSGQIRLSFDFGPPSDTTVTASTLFPVDVTVKKITQANEEVIGNSDTVARQGFFLFQEVLLEVTGAIEDFSQYTTSLRTKMVGVSDTSVNFPKDTLSSVIGTSDNLNRKLQGTRTFSEIKGIIGDERIFELKTVKVPEAVVGQTANQVKTVGLVIDKSLSGMVEIGKLSKRIILRLREQLGM